MKKESKRTTTFKELITKEMYSLDQAIELIQKQEKAKFVESIEAHVSLNIDPKYANQQLRTSLVLPHGTGKEITIAVLTDSDSIQECLDFGANIAGSDELIEEIGTGKISFDLLITTPQFMPKLAKLGRVLGPKGLMPSPKSGTVTQNVKEAVNEFKKGKLEYRADKTGIVHLSFGKANFSADQLKENLVEVYSSIDRNKPSGVKGRYFKSFYICTTMGPGIRLDFGTLRKS